MRKERHNFTLTEVLTVIAIIGVLAAIVAPVVIMSRDRGRVAQAQGDITAIVTALKQMHADYNKVLKKNGSKYEIGGQEVTTSSKTIVEGDAYDAMIAELSAPGNDGLTVSVNKRKKIYLDPKKEFDPSKNYNEVDADENIDNKAALYRDPWGKPYKILINANFEDSLAVNSKVNIPGNFAAYSEGPNGSDDQGCNADLPEDKCPDKDNHRDHDDIASWNI